jgi:SiaC family regulatory phosphoprotein
MENFSLAGTPKTPTVELNASSGTLLLKGRSIPENSIEFYKPILAWIEQYSTAAKEETTLQIQLEYFNTSSSKCLLDVFKRMETLKGKVVIEWYYENDDEDMLEAGEDYEAIIHVPFKKIGVEQFN